MQGFLGEAVFDGMAIQQIDKPRHAGAIDVGWHQECPCQLPVAGNRGLMVGQVIAKYFATIVL